ncbi:hypothetical protein AMAG_19760 [Allomyces macrogynus ATCC 38327]|uniref:Kinesin motor domain-containing protein n=1 Tax=Allomyces macrogynus (strain ATCC 38327) TaxID=578462 RepID=A0A0L0T1V4_ALLM3|nr:hypothetical protein AMAG_19760 [Allomyces macrogynus ATCC 38327]|eukprot:KNE68605.1 hypothetical protein AMAG_19760 [Allomyces macrogynus ATCC 38327]
MDPDTNSADGPAHWSGLPPASAPASRAGTTKSATTLRGEEHVRVVVRVRPLAAREAQDVRGLVVLDMQTVQLMDGKVMTYDRVYGESTTQADLFEDSGVMALVNRAIAGYSATVFAFG